MASPITDMRARNLVIIRFSFCPLGLLFGVAGPERAKNPAGKTPPPVSDPFSDAEFEKISPARQANSPQAEVADSSSRNAVSFSSALTINLFPSPRRASAIQIDAVEYAKFRSRSHDSVIRVYDDAGSVIETYEHKGDFKES